MQCIPTIYNIHCTYVVQAKAPGSSVIVVGTHIDLLFRANREDYIKEWRQMINAYKKNRAHSHLYPSIMGVCFVGIPKKGKHIGVHGPDGLADCIFDVAMKMEVPKGTMYMYVYIYTYIFYIIECGTVYACLPLAVAPVFKTHNLIC